VVNASGQAAGSGANADGELHALFWTQAGGVVDLGTLGGNFSQAQGIDDDGAVIGYSQLDDEGTVTHPFIWTQAGGMHDLGSLGGDFAIPSRMNDEGQVVGLSSTASGAMHGFSWTQAGGMVDLGTLDGAGMRSDATAVNDSGEIAGFNSSADESGSRAVLWEPPASAGNVHTFGPYAVTTTDNGCSGAPWATDTLSRTWEVKRGPNGSWRLRRIDRGTSVTSGGTSPGNCAANTTPHGTTVRAGTNGKVHGYLAGLVTGGTFNPNATCTADCGTTAGFVSTFFGPTAQFSCTTTSADCNFDFGYGAVGQRLRFYHWEDQGTGAGALLDEEFAGDIAN
jgi:probable HAF family extracellular repeat protein